MLVVDLDDSLVRTDLLYESLFGAIKSKPWLLPLVPLWIVRGKLALKQAIANHYTPDVALLPYRESVLELVRDARAKGQKTLLASASHEPWVKAVAAHLNLFDDVVGSSEVNLKGAAKLTEIRRRLGDAPFTYVGDSETDLPIWASAQKAVAVNPSPAVEKELRKDGRAPVVIHDRGPRLKAWRKALRVHQWAKNVLIFVPLIAGHEFLNPSAWLQSAQAFFAFSLLASSVYLFNDLLDLDADRQHPTKKHRPFASGTIPVRQGLIAAPLLVAASLALAWPMTPEFAWVLALYLAVNLLYTFRLKKLLILDVVALAALYTVRILAGGEATQIPVSSWLLACSTFFFFGLALVKRYTELLKSAGKKAHGRGYEPTDQPVVLSLGIGSSLLAVVVLALYLNSESVLQLYRFPNRLWLVAPLLLYWVSRLWVLAHRGQVDDDPVLFALKDRETYVTIALFLGVMVYAL